MYMFIYWATLSLSGGLSEEFMISEKSQRVRDTRSFQGYSDRTGLHVHPAGNKHRLNLLAELPSD